MSKFDEHIEKCMATAKNIGLEIDQDLLIKVAKGLGPAIYNKDASLVSCSDPAELKRVKENFLIGKLGLKDEGLDEVMERVCDELKVSKVKYRALFYTTLLIKLNLTNFYT